MEIESLHKYVSLNNLANGTVEVMFAGQPCLSVLEGGVVASGDSGGTWIWRINPVFAKLVYGANVFEDIPYCKENSDSSEKAIADGLVKLHELGAFRTEVDFPEDTYAATMNQIAEEVKLYALSKSNSILESSLLYSNIMKTIADGTFQIVVEKEVIEEPVQNIVIEENIDETVVEKSVDIFSKWSDKIDVSEKFNSDDYYLVDKKEKKVIRNVGQKRINPIHYRTPEKAPELSHYIKSDDHTVMSGMTLNRLGYINEARKQIPISDHPYHKKTDEQLRYIIKDAGEAAQAMKDHSPAAESKYLDQVNDASTVLSYRQRNGVLGPKNEAVEDEEYGKWQSEVKAAHPNKKLKFKGRFEKGVHTTSAEVSDKEDRSYGVWDHDKNKGHVFNESVEAIGELVQERSLTPEEKKEEEKIVTALKKDKKFVSTYGKDAAFAVATAKAKEVA